LGEVIYTSGIAQIGIAYVGSLVPHVHAVDCLAELGAGLLVYATRVCPCVMKVVSFRLLAKGLDFLVALAVLILWGDIAERQFFIFPSMREDGVAGYISEKCFELQRLCI
jgi:hypothetical protein